MNEQALNVWREFMETGTKYLAQECYEKAEIYFIQSVNVAQEMGIAVTLAFSLRLLATVRVKLGQFEQAKEGFAQALTLCEEIANAKGISEAKAGLASVLLANGFFAEAAKWYEEAIVIYPSTSPPLRLAMMYSDLGQAYSSIEEWEKAKLAYRQAEDLCRIHGYLKGEGEIKILLGEVCYKQGQKEEAKRWIERGCLLFYQIENESSLANALQYLAFICFELEDIHLAIQSQQRAITLWLRQNEEQEASESCYFLSKILQYLGEFGEAESYIEISITLNKREDVGLALRYQSLATIALLKSDFIRAEELFLKALKLFEEHQDEVRCGEIYEALAYVVEVQGREQEALEWQKRSIYKLYPHGSLAVDAIRRLGDYHKNRKQYVEALKCYWQAWEIARDLGIDTEDIEKDVQHLSKKVRKKKQI